MSKKKKQHNLLELSYGDHYVDQDHKILYACFDLFMDYLDEAARVHCSETYTSQGQHAAIIGFLDWEISLGDPDKWLEDDSFVLNTEQAYRGAIKKQLYIWWTKERPHRKDKINYETGKDLGMEEDDQMLHSLIGIRGSLWV